MLNHPKTRKLPVELLSVALALNIAAALAISAPKVRALSLASQELTVTASFAAQELVRPDEQIELLLSRPVQESEGRLAILIGRTDVSTLFTPSRLRLRYNAKLWPLPLGESQVVLYLVSPEGVWKERARFTLRVAGKRAVERVETDLSMDFIRAAFVPRPAERAEGAAAAFANQPPTVASGESSTKPADNNKMKFVPSLTITVKSQPAQTSFPDFARPARQTFTDVTMQASFNNEVSRGIFSSQATFDFAGASFRQEALRFSTLGDDAPKVDLATYLIQLKTGKIKYQFGHFSYGSQRHLINGFSSRGVMVTVPFLGRFDFSAAAMNGTQLVGYNNFLGISKRKHQLLSGTLGVELLSKRPGGLRLEVGLLSGYIQPLSGFNRGNINDTERSRGIALRLTASDKDGRFHFDAGFTRSLFISPNDQLLDQGLNVVKIPPLRRSAHYLEVSYDIFRDYSLTKTKKINLSVAYRLERVEPLFRSLGASTQADKIQHELAVNGSIGEISLQFSDVSFHDNLKNIPSILKSLTRTTHFSTAAPAAALFFDKWKNSPWLPRVGYSYDRVYSFGVAVPVNGGFEIEPSSVPNLLGTNQTFTADWQIKSFTVGYNFNHSFQNNRQIGRELADQGVYVNSGRFGFAPSNRLNLNIDLSAESEINRESGRLDRTYRVGPGFTFNVTKQLGLALNLSTTVAGDRAQTAHSSNTEFDTSLVYKFGLGRESLKKMSGQFFIRYANRYDFSRDLLFLTHNLRKSQTLTLNLGFTFF